MKNKILNFELDSKDIKVKKLLEGDFLRLEAYTISDAKPNRNGSHFTKEAMEKAIPSFFDKPVLAYYNPTLGKDGDFMGHECPNGLQYDESIDELYYDYDAPQSEIPIGTVRQSDTVELVEKDGLNWIKVTCVLWTKYNYKAVRSLLRSRNGKTKLSVEIEVLDGHEEDGIEIIDSFQLDGFTLLGRDRQNHEIEEGIAGAHAVAIDFLDENFAKHQQCLAFAYSALDKYNNQQNVETPDEAKAKKDSNKFNKDDSLNENEEQPQVSMEKENVNQEEGGISAMQLTMQAKIDLLREALQKAVHVGHDEEEYCPYVWVMDMDEQFVYYELGDDKFRCPYAITENEEGHDVNVDFSAQERVVPSWALFSAEEKPEEDEEDNLETEACGEKQNEDCNKTQEESCGDAKFDHEEGEEHKCIECTIHDLMIDEHEAIEGYRHAIAHFGEEFPAIVAVFQDIANEELEHLGELEKCLEMLNPEVAEELAEGHAEALETIIEAAEEEHAEEHSQEFAEEDKPEEGEAPAKEEEAKEPEEDEEPKKEEEAKEKDEPENVEAPKDNKGEDVNDFAEEPKDDDDDDDDEDEDDEDDKDDKDDDEKPEKEEEAACGKDSEFSNTLDPNAEPLNVDVDGLTMGKIIEDSTQSIKAPEVVTNVEHMGEANKGVASALPDVQQEVVNGDPDGTANEDGSPINPVVSVIQPNDADKEQDKQFVSEAEVSDVNVAELLKKYNELEEKFNQLNNAAKTAEAEKLLQFGKDFINADEVVDEENKLIFIAQLEEKCKAFEFETEEDVTKFAKGLMAMYYYEHQAVRKENNNTGFSVSLNRPAHNNNNASNAKLKDAINKLNYLNKEE